MEFLVVCTGLNEQGVLFDLKILSVLSKALVMVWNHTSLNISPFWGPEAILNAVSQICPIFATPFCEINFLILGGFLLRRLFTHSRAASAWFWYLKITYFCSSCQMFSEHILFKLHAEKNNVIALCNTWDFFFHVAQKKKYRIPFIPYKMLHCQLSEVLYLFNCLFFPWS